MQISEEKTVLAEKYRLENPMSVELSCGAGPIHVVLELSHPLLLDCHLGSSEPPLNITWLQDGVVLSESEAIRLLPNGSLLLLPSVHDDKASAGMEGAYSCLSGSSLGTLTSRSVTLQIASKYALRLSAEIIVSRLTSWIKSKLP
ncbi:immunoglobulin superfamily DCC subclass member 4-like isoform X2 [Tachysurus fulvidraco]|uniref:immunoglobulin superfamily DCC subclass member 4-like isoform X2 n=1 Tax=Tachysurus fulvidraco TaxID=1234273 RepID=UPI001FEEED11|nr:immunoglobulin superfamily DCC subclass member 4-like isoform X2 [Tachysurus fulvidraco]